MAIIPFHKPLLTGNEYPYLHQTCDSGTFSDDGPFQRSCRHFLQNITGCSQILLTPSCTAALEMAALLAGIRPGDEVIMPSFTFPSSANAFVLRGARPVFIDIRPDTLNMDERLIESAISARTRAIVPVHYAGSACEMDTIMEIAGRHQLLVIEDAAQCIGATYKGRALGTIGHLGAYSFHSTKNIHCGEGGALLINDESFAKRSLIIQNKGTNRLDFLNGQALFYQWTDIGSSYVLSELSCAFLWAQLQHLTKVTESRLSSWARYHQILLPAIDKGLLRTIQPHADSLHNGHIFPAIFVTAQDRQTVQGAMLARSIQTATHYRPLHQSTAGTRLATSTSHNLHYTQITADALLRLPIWHGAPVDEIGNELLKVLFELSAKRLIGQEECV